MPDHGKGHVIGAKARPEVEPETGCATGIGAVFRCVGIDPKNGGGREWPTTVVVRRAATTRMVRGLAPRTAQPCSSPFVGPFSEARPHQAKGAQEIATTHAWAGDHQDTKRRLWVVRRKDRHAVKVLYMETTQVCAPPTAIFADELEEGRCVTVEPATAVVCEKCLVFSVKY